MAAIIVAIGTATIIVTIIAITARPVFMMVGPPAVLMLLLMMADC
jgi:hypothetical protein